MRISRKRSEPVKETQMVSLADIAFLIIFFFFLSSQFMKDRTQIVLPKIPKAGETQAQLTVSMNVAGDVTLDGDKIEGNTIQERAKNLEDKLKEVLGTKDDSADKPTEKKKVEKSGEERREVRFRCDQQVTYENYRPIEEAISNADGIVAIMQDVK
jgi:biopolymer transport protein ExbD